jgi:hypothetical protein
VPAPTAPLIGFVLGVAFAWASSGELTRVGGSGVATRSLVVVSVFALVVFGPVAAYFLAVAPDWAYAYLVDSQRVPAAFDLGLLLLDVASVPIGFLLAARRASAQKVTPLLELGAVPLALVLTFFVVASRRLSVQATYGEFHGDFGTHTLAGSPLGYALLWMNLMLAGGVAWTVRCLRTFGRSPGRD